MALLGSEVVQGHVGVELEDVFMELARLQLDEDHRETRSFGFQRRGEGKKMRLTS